MKTLFRKWRGVPVAIAIASSTLAAHAAVQVKTLGGGPNEAGPSHSGLVNGDTLRQAKFNNPFSIAVDSNTNLYVADKSNNKIRKITKPGAADSLTSTFASKLPGAVGVAVDRSNLVYVVTQNDGRLRVFTSGGTLVRTVSGLVKPTALALDGSGNVYVTENVGNVKVIAPDDSTFLVTSGFGKLRGIAVLPNGLLAVSESDNHAIHTVDPNDGSTVLLAGGNGRGFADGPGASARFDQPHGLALAPDGSLVVADRFNHRVRVIDANGVVTTLYGIDKKQWSHNFPGWADGQGGESGTAAAREPLGLTVAKNGTVYVGEGFWDLIRQATGSITNSPGPGPGPDPGTNGTNVISFGFPSGEGSSDFVVAAGQHYYAPVTLSVMPNQKIYSLQFALTATNEGSVILNGANASFAGTLVRPNPAAAGTYVRIPINYSFLNTMDNLLGIGWITRHLATNLYNTLEHDLITYSLPKDHLFKSEGGKVILGGYRVVVPQTATTSDSYRITIVRPSAIPEDLTEDVPIRVPTDGSLGAGALNAVKRLSVAAASPLYVVGDAVPFRWFNAGEFGEGLLLNNDVVQVFESAVLGVNFPMLSQNFDNDLFNSMDSSDGSATLDGDDLQINNLTGYDNLLQVDDLYVTFRRSLDPSLKWFARYWSNGVRQTVEVPNASKRGRLDAPRGQVVGAKASYSGPKPSVAVGIDDVIAAPGAVLDLPVRLQTDGLFSLRVMMLSITVEPLDGSPSISMPISFQTAPTFQMPEFQTSKSANHFAAAWLNSAITGLSENGTLAILSLRVPSNAGTRAAYRIKFNHFSASPNGLSLFNSHTSNTLVLMSDRSASTWGDRIPDAWRLRYFGSIYAPESDLGADADGDGVINSIEFENGTDPTDSTSN